MRSEWDDRQTEVIDLEAMNLTGRDAEKPATRLQRTLARFASDSFLLDL